jgi:hypothetical protein
MDERAAACGLKVAPDAFVFSLEPDCSLPMSADYLTRRVAVLKEHVGIANKRPEVVAREDEALRLFRQPAKRRPKGKTGPELRGGVSYEEIGRRLGRSTRWAFEAVAAAERREAAAQRVLSISSTGRSSRSGSSHHLSCSTLGSTSAWWRNAKAMDPRFWSSTMPDPVLPRIGKRPSTSGRSSTELDVVAPADRYPPSS